LGAAAGAAPREPGVYLFLGGAREVLYVGKASNLRHRLHQHAVAGPPTSHLHKRYDHVRRVVWEIAPDEEAATWREADLIFAFRPPFNANPGLKSADPAGCEARPPFVVVADDDGILKFSLEPGPHAPGTRAYGCFPHLGKGVSSRLGIACSDGYVAFLRLLWAASGRGAHMPASITKSAPASFTVALGPWRLGRLHAFLSAVSARLLDDLAQAATDRPAYMQLGLARDQQAASLFFAAGPRLVRARRLRHGLATRLITPEKYRALVIAEIRDSTGELVMPHN